MRKGLSVELSGIFLYGLGLYINCKICKSWQHLLFIVLEKDLVKDLSFLLITAITAKSSLMFRVHSKLGQSKKRHISLQLQESLCAYISQICC